MAAFLVDNAITWAQMRLRGNVAYTVKIASAYTVLLVGAMIVSAQMSTAGLASLSGQWMTVLLVLQTIILLFHCGGRINTAVRADVDGGMLESHRLMPIAPSAAATGYIVGPATQGLVLVGVNLVLGLWVAGLGSTIPRWLAANLILLAFAVFVWVVVECAAFVAKGAFSIVVLVPVLAWISGGVFLSALPALNLLLSPLLRASIFSVGSADISIEHGVALLGQIAIGTACFSGSVRRFRRDDIPAISPAFWLLVVLTFAALSVFGILNWNSFRLTILARNEVSSVVQFIVSLVATFAISFAAIGSSVRLDRVWQAHRMLDDPGLEARPMPPVFATMLAFIICCGVLMAAPHDRVETWRPYFATAANLLVAIFGGLLLTRLLGNAFRAVVIVGFFAAVTPIADLVWQSALATGDGRLSQLSTLSPIGVLVLLWGAPRPDASVWIGIGAQAALVLVLWGVFRVISRRESKRA
jgi:hypothetical protein